MRSSVADPNRLAERQSPSSYPMNKSTTQHIRRPSAPAQSTIVPTEGWFVLILLAVAVYSVTLSVVAANWVDHSMILLCSPIVGLLTGLAVAKTPVCHNRYFI